MVSHASRRGRKEKTHGPSPAVGALGTKLWPLAASGWQLIAGGLQLPAVQKGCPERKWKQNQIVIGQP